MSSWLRDLLMALRQFRLRPGLWSAIVLTLALGLGANAAVFHVFERLLLAPLPYANGERLVFVYNTYPKMGLNVAGTSIPDYFDRLESVKSFESMAVYNEVGMNLTGSGAAQRVNALRATPSYFETLGVGASLGRLFGDEEAKPGNDKVVVIGAQLWQEYFGGAKDVVGREIALDGENWRVLGVMPVGFEAPGESADLFIPFAITEEQKADGNRGNEFSMSIARLAPGATIEGANAEMDAIVKRNADRLPVDYKEFFDSSGFTGVAKDMREFTVGSVAGTLATLQLATLLVLLIACANVANLLLAQNIARSKEFAVRNAIGAVRSHLIRQTMAETLVAALAGGLAGLLIAHGVLWVLREFAGSTMLLAKVEPVLPLGTQLLVLVAGMVLVPLIAALPLALTTRASHVAALKDSSRGNTGSQAAARARSTLVVVQLAMSSALLVTAGLLLRSYWATINESPGFDANHVVSAFVELPDARYPDAAAKNAFFERALAQARSLPGVEQAGWVTGLPFTQFNWGQSYRVRGVSYPGMPPHANMRMADGGYFDTLKIPLLKGRGFNETDRGDSEKVAVIDEYLARKHFADVDPIGQYVGDEPSEANPNSGWRRVIGVVGTVKNNSLDQTVEKETIYLPLSQFAISQATLVLRSPRDPELLISELRQVLQRVDPNQAVFNVATLTQRVDDSLGIRRAPLLLVAAFAVIALLLAAIGLYAVLAFVVGRRSGEIGLRIAIGAQSSDVMRMVLGQGLRLLGLGLGIGLLIAAFSGRFVASQLFGVTALDPLTFLIVALSLGLVALLASLSPARRASRVDPMIALRNE